MSAPPPIVLLAPARSFSTVAVAMFSGHSRILGVPELLLFPVAHLGDLDYAPPAAGDERDRWNYFNASGRLRAVAQLEFGGQGPANLERARRWLLARKGWTTDRFARWVQAAAAPHILLEKSPQTVASDLALDACAETWPDARYVHVTRDPATAIPSMCRRWASLNRVEPTHPGLVMRAARSWYLSHRRIELFLGRTPGERRTRVMGESLVSQPGVAESVLDALGVRSEPADVAELYHPERWVFTGTGGQGDLAGGDTGFLGRPTLRSAPTTSDQPSALLPIALQGPI